MNFLQWAAGAVNRRWGNRSRRSNGGYGPASRPQRGSRGSGDAARIHWVRAQVAAVVDGDTIKVAVNGVQETVRLLLIDTPETVHPTKGEEPFSREASNFVKQSLPEGSWVDLELNVNERDKYGRFLAYVWVNGHMLNQALVAAGLARIAYISAGDVKYLPLLRQIEAQAQMQGLGVWSIPQRGGAQMTIPVHAIPPGAIKGTVSARGDRIYHVPGGASYAKTRANAVFATEYEAVAAGFRRAKR